MGFMVSGGWVFTRATCLLYYGVFDTLHMDLAACNSVAVMFLLVPGGP